MIPERQAVTPASGRYEELDFKLLSEALVKAGAGAVAAVRAEAVGEEDRRLFERWLAGGHNAGMGYMANWPELRFDPRVMHEGTRWVVCCAFPYAQNLEKAPTVASYALGDDYHKWIPKTVREALRGLENDFNETARICVDSAPVRERYWAVKSGMGERCDSGLVSIPGLGTQFFLCEILTTWELTGVPENTGQIGAPEKVDPMGERCDHCGACRKACPAGAILEDGTVDARRCVSYLTIEHKGEWTDDQKRVMALPGARDRLFGCEICQRVCHLNRNVPTSPIEAFRPRPDLLSLNPETVATLTPDLFNRLTRNSPLRRTGLDALRRSSAGFQPV